MKYPACVKKNHQQCPEFHAASKCECWCHDQINFTYEQELEF
jgi:hypothetical protein